MTNKTTLPSSHRNSLTHHHLDHRQPSQKHFHRPPLPQKVLRSASHIQGLNQLLFIDGDALGEVQVLVVFGVVAREVLWIEVGGGLCIIFSDPELLPRLGNELGAEEGAVAANEHVARVSLINFGHLVLQGLSEYGHYVVLGLHLKFLSGLITSEFRERYFVLGADRLVRELDEFVVDVVCSLKINLPEAYGVEPFVVAGAGDLGDV